MISEVTLTPTHSKSAYTPEIMPNGGSNGGYYLDAYLNTGIFQADKLVRGHRFSLQLPSSQGTDVISYCISTATGMSKTSKKLW